MKLYCNFLANASCFTFLQQLSNNIFYHPILLPFGRALFTIQTRLSVQVCKVSYRSTPILGMRYGHSWASTIKISYVRLDSLVFNSKITAASYLESLIKTQSQDRHSIYLGKPSRGRKHNKTSYV